LPEAAVGSPWSFSIGSLMLVVTLAAVCLGLGAAAPGLGIALAIVATPALVRTFVSSAQRKAQGERLQPGDKVATFAASVGVVLLAGVAAGVAFFATCLIACFPAMATGSDTAIQVGLVACVLAALVAGGLLMRVQWPAHSQLNPTLHAVAVGAIWALTALVFGIAIPNVPLGLTTLVVTLAAAIVHRNARMLLFTLLFTALVDLICFLLEK
jgi:hypothetical protein